MNRKTEFAGEYQRTVRDLLDNLNKLNAMKTEFVAMNYGVTMADPDLTDLGILKTDLIAASSAVDAIQATVNTGTNAKSLYTVAS